MQLLMGILGAFGLSASAGLNAYIPLLVVGSIAHYTDWITLNSPWDTLANPWVLIVLGILVIIEMLADKFPAVNHINDAIQTFVRPAAGAIVFAASANVITDIHPVLSLICGLLIAGSVHVVKSVAVRPAVTATTGGAGNVPVSIIEDITATILSILSVVLPILVGILLIVIAILVYLWWHKRRNRSRPRALS
ncbi:MAG: DUF4126 domain-containing protein [Anaerolineales bacterium]|nr:DUF4126 domain-containing protein [Anaerolineales bacterium]